MKFQAVNVRANTLSHANNSSCTQRCCHCLTSRPLSNLWDMYELEVFRLGSESGSSPWAEVSIDSVLKPLQTSAILSIPATTDSFCRGDSRFFWHRLKRFPFGPRRSTGYYIHFDRLWCWTWTIRKMLMSKSRAVCFPHGQYHRPFCDTCSFLQLYMYMFSLKVALCSHLLQ